MNDHKSNQQPFERFNLTEERFRQGVKQHLDFNKSKPCTRSSDDLPFYDWEASALARILDKCQDDVEATVLVMAMMKLVDDDIKRRHAEDMLRLVPKPQRANTMGMFFAPPLVAKSTRPAST